MHHARYTPERFIDSHGFDQFKAATEILFRRRLWVDDTPVLGVECAMPSLLLRGAGETTNQAEGEPAAPGQDC